MNIACLFILGLCFGSFINAFVWRIQNRKDWIRGRSECPNCSHELSLFDLIPVLSWLSLRAKCRYCKQPISWQYPIIELATAAWFIASYYYWPTDLGLSSSKLLFAGWLISSVGLISLIIFDHRWMILPTKIIYSFLIFAGLARFIYIFGYSGDVRNSLLDWALSVLVASGLFFVIHEVSKGQWIGFGDVRLGLLTGTLLASPEKSVIMIFLASIIGCLFALPRLFASKKVLSYRFAFGPFLIAGCFISVLFGQRLIDWYVGLL